jgi:hypothetical protein
MMIGDTSASACQMKMHHYQLKTTTGTKRLEFANGFKYQLNAQQVNSTTTKTTHAVAMNNPALLATTSTLTPTFAAADASEAFAQITTTGMIRFANASVKLFLAMPTKSSTTVPANVSALNQLIVLKRIIHLTGRPADADVLIKINAQTKSKTT